MLFSTCGVLVCSHLGLFNFCFNVAFHWFPNVVPKSNFIGGFIKLHSSTCPSLPSTFGVVLSVRSQCSRLLPAKFCLLIWLPIRTYVLPHGSRTLCLSQFVFFCFGIPVSCPCSLVGFGSNRFLVWLSKFAFSTGVPQLPSTLTLVISSAGHVLIGWDPPIQN